MVDRLRKTYLPFEVSFEKPQEKPKKVTKKELARLAKEVGEKHFYADCKKHGKGVKHYTSDTRCTFCMREHRKRYCEENRESLLEYHKNYREENKEMCSERKKKCYEKNKETYIERSKKYYEGNKEAISRYRKKYREENKEAFAERNKKYYEGNREHYKEYRKDNAAYIFVRSVLTRLDSDKQEAFSGITKDEAESLCGYSQVEFILHIESTFKEGMSWENRSEWHIDHILPVAWFREQGITDIKVINALSNLRAEWASDNISKGRNFLEEDLTEEEFLEIIMNEVDNGKDF